LTASDATAPALSPTPPRILVVSHSHPEISKGGAEIAAFQLYRGYAAREGGVAWFLGCDRRPTRSETVITQPFGVGDYLYAAGDFDWFKFANRDPRLPKALTDLLLELQPDVVHFHHYINVGVEAFALVRRVLPEAKIVVTLHEYLAICNHHGQMVTSQHRNLCYQASPARCIECFPQFDDSDFFLRKRYIEHFFAFVDHFVSPSQFLATRYIEWGVSEDRISVIENVVRTPLVAPACRGIDASGTLRAGFFGQLSFLKGAKVLFDAADLLSHEARMEIGIEIFGDYRNQPAEFQEELQERMARLGRNVTLHGPYSEAQVDMLMQSVDVIIVPSIWWENSPLVIQEALRNGRPLLCSDIGGMAEKVRDGLDGFHFHAGSAVALARLLKRLADNPQLLIDVSKTMQKTPSPDSIIDRHLALYQTLRTPVAQDAIYA
jgi:glycosyltransferase involved in cell wall biosynthesis